MESPNTDFQTLDPLETVQWQWQSDSDPWKEQNPARWNWQNFSEDECLIIEKAFSLNQETADLKDYEIDLRKLLQVNKKHKDRIRRVRRQQQSRFMLEIPQPSIINHGEKTINEAFGTIQHFLNYIMKRTPEAYGLYQRLRKLHLDSKDSQFDDIIQEVIVSVEKGAEKRERIIKSRSTLKTTNFLDEAKIIVDLIKKNSGNLRQFLSTILKVYTMESYICYWLNELLRCENWEEMNILTPYLVCLVYTFQLSDYIVKYQEPQGMMKSLLGLVKKQKLCLYRGAALSKEHMRNYHFNPYMDKYFSWNAVTSTSKNKNIALEFIGFSLAKARRFNEDKVGILFKIETDFTSDQDCEGLIDVSLNSKYPDEQEIILAPGTVFKLRKTREIDHGIYEIGLKVTRKFQENTENLALLGDLQDLAITKDKAILPGLPSPKSFRILELLKGNKLVRKLEIRKSEINHHILGLIEDMRITTNVKKHDIKLTNNIITISSLSVLSYYFSEESLSEICLLNEIVFKDQEFTNDWRMKRVILEEQVLDKFRKDNQLKELWEKVKNEDQITSLELSLKNLKIQQEELTNLLACMESLKCLENLQLNLDSSNNEGFGPFWTIIEALPTLQQLSLRFLSSDEELQNLKEKLVLGKSLRHLSLDFKECKMISDEGISHLKSVIISGTSLGHLSINFEECSKISDSGLDHLAVAILPLTNLQHLSLNFNGCKEISSEGLNHLKSALTSLTNLQHLSLAFQGCNFISDGGLIELHRGISLLISLQHLSLNFNSCKNISDLGFCQLINSFLSATSLQHLSLEFNRCHRFSDQAFVSLKNSLKSLTSLQHLSLNVGFCQQISDEGLDDLKTALISLTNLQHLSLNFAGCFRISDIGMSSLAAVIAFLTSLNHLSLNCFKCHQISDESLNSLKKALLASTAPIQHLSLNFNECQKISDEGLNHLKALLKPFGDLQHLDLLFKGCDISLKGLLAHLKDPISATSLQNLSLDLAFDPEITNYGLCELKNLLTSVISLQYLSLDFTACKKIQDEGLNFLKAALKTLANLHHLSLNFDSCKHISDEGVFYLTDAFSSLKFLNHLSLNFYFCDKLSDDTLNHLKSALVLLPDLQHVSLAFKRCEKFTSSGLKLLSTGLSSLKLLQHLSLDLCFCKELTDYGVVYLKNALLTFTTLRYLALDFWRCDPVSDKALNHLRAGLISLTSLQQLSIDFGFCKKISDRGVEYLLSAFVQLTTLEYLSLGLAKCSKVSDLTLKNLKAGLVPLRSLQNLSLNFAYCQGVSDQGLNYLLGEFVSLKRLQFFYLNFDGCQNVSNNGISNLEIALVQMNSLYHLSLYLRACGKISNEKVSELKDSLQGIHQLNICI